MTEEALEKKKRIREGRHSRAELARKAKKEKADEQCQSTAYAILSQPFPSSSGSGHAEAAREGWTSSPNASSGSGHAEAVPLYCSPERDAPIGPVRFSRRRREGTDPDSPRRRDRRREADASSFVVDDCLDLEGQERHDSDSAQCVKFNYGKDIKSTMRASQACGTSF